MTHNATHPSGKHSLRGTKIPPSNSAQEAIPDCAVSPTHAQRPSFLKRVGKYSMIVGGLCGIVGALEGALTGSMLASSKDPTGLILIVAIDRCILLGLVGAGIGAAIGALDWGLGGRKKKNKK